MKPKWLKWLDENALKFQNVVGYSQYLEPRVIERTGKIISFENCVRIFVSQKLPESLLPLASILPKMIDDWPVDVVTKGTFYAPPLEKARRGRLKTLTVQKTSKVRPIPLGVSIGHWDITAGSLGMIYKKDMKEFGGSNAHVLTPNPSMYPYEVLDTRILQPGAYHDGQKDANVIGNYEWHERIIPTGQISDCDITRLTSGLLNTIAKGFHRKTRLIGIVPLFNNIDFGVYSLKSSSKHDLRIADSSIDMENSSFFGHLFAGSQVSGIICNVKHILERGYVPLVAYATNLLSGMKVKGCSFWCNYQTVIEEASAVVTVNYGSFIAIFQDVVLVRNDGTIKGGWSGSGWWVVE